MVKKYTRNRKYTGRSRTRRQYRGGDQAEVLRFRYTKDPKRIAWIEALYPYSSQIASIPGLIPWKEYSYDGKTIVHLKKDADVLLDVKANAAEIPYKIGGGAASELYNAKFKKLGGPDLHETADPTADVDIFIGEPSISIRNPNKFRHSIIIGFDKRTNTLSPLYDHYTRWIIEHVVNILRPIAAQMPSPPFVAPTEESISKLVKLENVDIQTRVGNILILREKPYNRSSYIKIQCITTVQTKEGLQITDHFCEFLLMDDGIEISPYSYETPVHALTDIPGISVPFLFVDPLADLIDEQINAFDFRKEAEDKSKAKNHHGRIIFLYKLGMFLQANKYAIDLLDDGNYTEDKLVALKKQLGDFVDI